MNTKKKILISSLLLSTSLIGIISTNNFNNKHLIKTFVENNTITNYNEDVPNSYKMINGVKLSYPTINGPKKLNIVKGEKFHPSNYNYLVYDQLENPNGNIEVNLSGINTNNLGEQNFRISYTNKYNMNVSKEFTINVVEENEFLNQNIFEYSLRPKIVNAEFMKWNSATSDWLPLLPVVIQEGETLLIEKINGNFDGKLNIQYLTEGGVVNANEPSKLNPKNITLGKDFTANFNGVVYIQLPYLPYSNETLDLKITIKNPKPNSRKQLSIYNHGWTDISIFKRKWNKNNSAAAVLNTFALWALTKGDLTELGQLDSLTLWKAMDGYERMLKAYSNLTGLSTEINQPEDLVNLKVNARHLMYSEYKSNQTIAYATSSTMVTTLKPPQEYKIGPFTDFNNGQLKHEAGHYFQGSYKNKNINLIDTSNIFNWLYFDWSELVKKQKDEFLKTYTTVSDEKQKEFEQNAWKQLSYVEPFDTMFNAAKTLKQITQINNNVFPSLDPYDPMKQYIFINIFQKVGWEAWNYFNKEWRKIDSSTINDKLSEDLKIQGNFKSKSIIKSNSNFADSFYYLIGEYSKYDVSAFLNRVGIKISPNLIKIGMKKGWKPIGILNELDPEHEEEVKEKYNLPTIGNLVDNSQLDKNSKGDLIINILGALPEEFQNNTKIKTLKLIDNTNEFEKEIEIKNNQIKISNLPIGLYYLEIPTTFEKNQSIKTSNSLIIQVTKDSQNVININFEELNPNKITSNYINIDGETKKEKDIFKVKLNSNELEFISFWKENIKIQGGTSNNQDYPQNSKFITYKLFNEDGSEYNDSNAKGEYFANADERSFKRQINSESGEVNEIPVIKNLKLDFSNNKKYKLELFSQISKNIRLKNDFYDEYVSPENTWNILTHEQNNYDSNTWSESFKKTKTFIFTIDKNGIKLGWKNLKGTYRLNRSNSIEEIGYNQKEKESIQNKNKELILKYLKSQKEFLKLFNEQELQSGFNENIKAIKMLINSLSQDYLLNYEENSQVNEIQNWINNLENIRNSVNTVQKDWSFLSENPWIININKEEKFNLDDILNQIKYIDHKNKEHFVKPEDITYINLPIGENGKILESGRFRIKIEIETIKNTKIITELTLEVE